MSPNLPFEKIALLDSEVAMHRSTGFTLIETMVILAILGVLASVALPLYRDYIRDANMMKVNQHYGQAVRAIENRLRQVQSRIAINSDASLADLLPTKENLIDSLNSRGGTAPGGGNPYADEASKETGAIGISVSGTGATFSVIVSRPVYGGLPEESQTITYSSL